MNELQVIVQQDPGQIKWNFQDLKEALKKELEVYKTTQYDDDSIKDAKKDLAELRKLKTKVEDKRKEIKNKCLEPYAIIEEQAHELNALIDEPINEINARVQEYETARKEKCRKKIQEYMTEAFADIPEDIATKAKDRLYDPRWENASAKEKDWKAAIDSRRDIVVSELDVIKKTTEDEFFEDAMTAYKKNLLLADATNKVYELRQQRERFIKQQEAREAARIAQEEREKRLCEEQQRREAEVKETPVPESDMGKVIESIDRGNFVRSVAQEPVKIPETVPQRVTAGGVTLRIIGNEKQCQKIKDYIKFVGASYKEV